MILQQGYEPIQNHHPPDTTYSAFQASQVYDSWTSTNQKPQRPLTRTFNPKLSLPLTESKEIWYHQVGMRPLVRRKKLQKIANPMP